MSMQTWWKCGCWWKGRIEIIVRFKHDIDIAALKTSENCFIMSKMMWVSCSRSATDYSIHCRTFTHQALMLTLCKLLFRVTHLGSSFFHPQLPYLMRPVFSETVGHVLTLEPAWLQGSNARLEWLKKEKKKGSNDCQTYSNEIPLYYSLLRSCLASGMNTEVLPSQMRLHWPRSGTIQRVKRQAPKQAHNARTKFKGR